MSYDSNNVLAIKFGVLLMFCCFQGDDDDADDEIPGAGSSSNKANVYGANLFSPASCTFFLCQGCKDIAFYDSDI
jgi:hypothetical protein